MIYSDPKNSKLLKVLKSKLIIAFGGQSKTNISPDNMFKEDETIRSDIPTEYNNSKLIPAFKSMIDIDMFCRVIIPEDTIFFHQAAHMVLQNIMIYCVKENITEIDELLTIVNSDSSNIIRLLSKYNETNKGLKIIRRNDNASENILGVLSHFFSVYFQKEVENWE
jgi:hypothetical protein